jgi:hypothetical protein
LKFEIVFSALLTMFAGDGELEGDHGLSAYELERVAHIRRNREVMARLGGAVQVDSFRTRVESAYGFSA